MRRKKLRCPECNSQFLMRVGRGWWCQACSTPLVLVGNALWEVLIECREFGSYVPATRCRTCDNGAVCIRRWLSMMGAVKVLRG